jgi:hypothetical protein
MLRVLLVFCTLLLGLVQVERAFAQEEEGRVSEPLVVVLRAHENEGTRWLAAERRLMAELAEAGLTVVSVQDTSREESWAVLRALTALHQAIAAVRVQSTKSGGRAQIWLSDLGRGRAGRRVLSVNSGAEAAPTLALRTAELLHASWFSVELPEEPPEALPKRPRDVEPEPVATLVEPVSGASLDTERARLMLGPWLAAPFGGIAPSFGIAAGADIRLGSGLFVDPMCAASGLGGSGTIPGAQVDVQAFLGRLSLAFAPFPDALVSPSISVAAAGLWMQVRARSTDSTVAGKADSDLVFLPTVGGGLRFAMTERIALGLSGNVGFAVPAFSLRRDERAVVRELGRPWVDAMVGVQWAL